MRGIIWSLVVILSSLGMLVAGPTPRAAAQADPGSEDSAAETESSEETDAAESAESGEAPAASVDDPAGDGEASGEETGETDTGAEDAEVEEPVGISLFEPGSFDVMASLGLGSLLYPILEIGVDIGVVPLTDELTLSLGASGAAGYCLLCAGVSALGGFRIDAWNVSPQARLALHYNFKEALGAPLDGYLAFSSGPDFYFVNIQSSGATATGTVFSWAFVPVVGGRYFPPGMNNLFIYGEARWLTEFGVSGGTYTNEQWDQNITWTGSGYSRRGFDFILGGGLRF